MRKLASSSKRAKEITQCLAEFIAKDMRPVAIVEGKGFLKLMETLEPAYEVPSRKTIVKVLRDLQQEV